MIVVKVWSKPHMIRLSRVGCRANALGVGQGDVLSVKDLSAGDAAVRLAFVIQENRNYFSMMPFNWIS
jgi:hypothetical protein